MLDKLLKMDSALLTIKTQIAKYKALFEADGEIDAAERAFLNALEEDAKRVDEKLGKVIVKAKAVATEKPVTIEKTEALAVEEVAVTEKAAGGMEEVEAVPAMSGEEKGAGDIGGEAMKSDAMQIEEKLGMATENVKDKLDKNEAPGDELILASNSTKIIICSKAFSKLGWHEKDILVLSLSSKGNSSDYGLGLSIHNFIIGKYPQNKKSKIAVNAIDATYFFIYNSGPASFIDKTAYSKEEEGAIKFRLLFDFANGDVNHEKFELPPNVRPETLIGIWGDLVNQKYDKETFDKLKEFGGNASIQHIENAVGEDVNLDFFSVEIKKLPKGVSDKEFFNYFRKHINEFIDNKAAKFKPYDSGETEQWNSDDYKNAIVHIDMTPGTYPWSTYVNPEDGSIIVSKQEDLRWVFTTIYVFQDGRHPVSGNREFGLKKNSNGTYTFYTAGADRATGLDDAEINHWSNAIFSGADNLWNSLQVKMEDYIDKHGGEATANPDVIARPSWDNAKSILK